MPGPQTSRSEDRSLNCEGNPVGSTEFRHQIHSTGRNTEHTQASSRLKTRDKNSAGRRFEKIWSIGAFCGYRRPIAGKFTPSVCMEWAQSGDWIQHRTAMEASERVAAVSLVDRLGWFHFLGVFTAATRFAAPRFNCRIAHSNSTVTVADGRVLPYFSH